MAYLAIADKKTDFVQRVRCFAKDESGATAIEYSLIVSLIFLAVVGSIRAYTASTNDMYNEISDAVVNG